MRGVGIDCGLLKTFRKKTKITQRELARETGLSNSAIYKFEHGEISPTLNNILLIADAIDRRVPGSKKILLDSITDDITRKSLALADQKLIDRETVQERLIIANTLIESVMEELPSVQPEPEIIACGDCKHYICHDRRCGYWNHGVKPLEWCCHGEERNE